MKKKILNLIYKNKDILIFKTKNFYIVYFQNSFKKYNNVELITSYLFKIEKDNKFGFINLLNNTCEIKYDFIKSEYNGFIAVKLNNKWGFVNIFGKEICEIKYDHVDNFLSETGSITLETKLGTSKKPSIKKLAIVKLNNKYGFIDETGKEICPIKYDWVSNFFNKTAIVRLNDTRRILHSNGEEKFYYNDLF